MYFWEPARIARKEGMTGLLRLSEYKHLTKASKERFLSLPPTVFLSAMEKSGKWVSDFESDCLIGLKNNQLQEFVNLIESSSLQIMIIHHGNGEDKLHTPKTAIELAKILKVQQVHVIPGILEKNESSIRDMAISIKATFEPFARNILKTAKL